jgi:hypothetical protein
MSDFKDRLDFQKGKLAQSPYQDPTYLSFVILFNTSDHTNSPLLSGAAEEFYTQQLGATARNERNIDNATKKEGSHGLSALRAEESARLDSLTDSSPTVRFYEDRLQNLIKFKKALLDINRNTPWFFQGLQGIDRAVTAINPSNPYYGGDDAKLTLSCLESINLRVSGLMHLYRKAVFDEVKWNWILPENLRKFSMVVYVTEIRKIQNMSKIELTGVPKKIDIDTIKGFPGNLKPKVGVGNSNEGISGSANRPFFMFRFGECEFSLNTGSEIFGDLTKNPGEQARQSIEINYEVIDKMDARVLNGIVSDTIPDALSPAADSENYAADGIGGFLEDKIKGKLKELGQRGLDDLNRLAREKKDELVQGARDAVRGRVPNFENIYQDALRGVSDGVDNIGATIAENVFNVDTSATVGEALTRAAEESLGNVND